MSIEKSFVSDLGVGIKTEVPPDKTWKTYDRLSWDDYFLNIAKAVSLRSTCPRLQVGAVIVDDNKIIATGFNGASKSEDHCIDVGCLIVNGRCKRAIHAEANAIEQACMYSTIPEGYSIYVTHSPCKICIEDLENVGITNIHYSKEYK